MLKKRQVSTLVGIAVISFLIGTILNVNFMAIASEGTDGYGIPFDEIWKAISGLQAEVDSLNTRIPKKGCISVSAAAFVAQHSGVDFAIYPWEALALTHAESWTVYFYGSAQLPDGATVKKVTSYWWDMGNENIVCRLKRYNQTQNQEMAEIWSSGDPGHGSSHDDTIALATVDNSQYAYYLEVGIPGEQNGHGLYYFKYAIIEYEYLT